MGFYGESVFQLKPYSRNRLLVTLMELAENNREALSAVRRHMNLILLETAAIRRFSNTHIGYVNITLSMSHDMSHDMAMILHVAAFDLEYTSH